MNKLYKLILVSFLLSACAGNPARQVVTTSKQEVVMPPPQLFQCQRLLASQLPNVATLTDVQVARVIRTLWRNNETCANNIAAIKDFLERAKRTTER